MRQSAGEALQTCKFLMDAADWKIVLIGRKNAGVCDDQQNYSGKNYINNKVCLVLNSVAYLSEEIT
jgi:hypothetical protein